MAATTSNILIFGATGLIGSHIANSILENKDKFGKIAIFTSQNTVFTKAEEIDSLKKRGASIVEGDMTSESDVYEAYNGFDTIVSAVGRPVIDKQLKLIELAEKHPDVKRFFPSEYGTDIEYDSTSANEKPHQLKLQVRALLRLVHKLQHTFVVTGPYADADSLLYLCAKNPEIEAQGTFDVKRKRAVLLGDGNGRISLTTMRDVGKLVVAALLRPEAAKNKALRVNSFTTTPHELAAEFEKQTGGEKWSIAYTSLDELKKLETETPSVTLRRIWTEGKTLYEKRDNHLIEAEEGLDDLQSTVRQAIEVQQKRIADGTLY
ncbi:Putative NmrA-like domain, NAD(P)-binding domain superfamily [Septoria linicola]|uniref:NmrA-like domain, NAD(P)-binding domain superfamily n=1 Tax=Septoria linicola TaxID=215465 RepID=A0A9Q9EHC6_9PEZI|nr:putative NmrA-like domain, NAD(P)-binding domain superfamily [Septoria linicola]USW49859.1 Putative NmrA-like domain, NAD(P)-binding domain superfamily [Septoria linicola]